MYFLLPFSYILNYKTSINVIRRGYCYDKSLFLSFTRVIGVYSRDVVDLPNKVIVEATNQETHASGI